MTEPADADVLLAFALERVAAGDPRTGMAAIHAAAIVAPDRPMTAARMAEIVLQTRGGEAALAWLRRLDALASGTEAASLIQARILLSQARAAAASREPDRAARLFRSALVHAPSDYAALLDLAGLVAPPPAAALLHRSLAVRRWAGPCINLGNLDKSADRSTAAVGWYRRALAEDPVHPFAWNNLATTWRDRAELPAALGCYRRALACDPGAAATESNLLQALQFDPRIDDAALALAHRRWAERHAPRATLSPPRQCARMKRLTIGYVSPDLGRHPVGFFLLPVLVAHDRRLVRVTCYATRDMGDEVTLALRGAADTWVDASAMDDDALARRIRADAIDVLVDLSGHTAHHRLALFARRAAPVQATWLGYFDTTGLDAFDMLLTDAWEVPPGAERRFSEPVIRMAAGRFAYEPPAYAPAPVPPPSLPRDHVVFGCFNNLGKLTDDVVRLWSRLLATTPRSMLLLKWASLADAGVAASITRRFARHGLDPVRLILRGASPHAAMLAEYGDVDIALDPFPFSGCLTTVEALWMGVPVVTLAGRRPVSRQSAAVLWRLGLEDLVGADEDDYVRIAGALAQDTTRRATLRLTLRERMRISICNGRAVAADLETAYRAALRARSAHSAE
jgi:predicted O-linked N-acetylglucosamine transferase (SPINDLY family)